MVLAWTPLPPLRQAERLLRCKRGRERGDDGEGEIERGDGDFCPTVFLEHRSSAALVRHGEEAGSRRILRRRLRAKRRGDAARGAEQRVLLGRPPNDAVERGVAARMRAPGGEGGDRVCADNVSEDAAAGVDDTAGVGRKRRDLAGRFANDWPPLGSGGFAPAPTDG